MKKFLTFTLSLTLLVGVFAISSSASANTSHFGYSYEYVTQSAYPSTLAPNEVTNVWIEIKNTGTKTWYDKGIGAIRLGSGSAYGATNQRRDYDSEFYNDDWLSKNRPASLSDGVGLLPGLSTKLRFSIKAPQTPGTYKAYFTPVIDGITWMKDIGIYWQITVDGTSSGDSTSPSDNNSGDSSIPVTGLIISPVGASSIQSGDVKDFTVTATYSNGSSQDVTDMADWDVVYGTGTGTMHTGIPGRFIAGGIGTLNITATFGGVSTQSGTVEVTPL